MKVLTKSDFLVRWIVHPLKPHLRYIQVLDRMSNSVWCFMNTRNVHLFGDIRQVMSIDDLERLFNKRLSTEYENYKYYELTEVCP